jgi:hypothetical protein
LTLSFFGTNKNKMDPSNALSASYNSAAVLTRQLQHVFRVPPTALAGGTVLDRITVQTDAQCPFFYIFAIGTQSTATAGPAIKTKYEFSNGGSPLTQVEVGWGNQSTLNSGVETFLSVLTTPNDGIAYFHDPVSVTCSAVNPGNLDEQGFVKRWTCLADQIVITSVLYADFDFTALPMQLAHGILQQPW